MSREMYYLDENGKKQDAALHADILEADDDPAFSTNMDAVLLQGRINRNAYSDWSFREHWKRYEKKRKELGWKGVLKFPEGVNYPDDVKVDDL